MNPLLVIFGIVALALYFLPTIVGASRRAPRFGTILLINLFFGWSLLPWIFAMWMAFRSDPVRPIGAMPQAPRQTQAGNNAALNGRRCTECGRALSPEDPFLYICGVCRYGGDGTITRSLQGAAVAGIREWQDDKTVGPSEISPSGGSLERHFSGTKSNGFSLREQMRFAGVESIDHFYELLVALRSDPSELRRLADAVASIPADDDLGRVLARLMFAASYVPAPPFSEAGPRILAALEIANVPRPGGFIDGMPAARFSVLVPLAGIDGARANGLANACIESLGLIGSVWGNDLPPEQMPGGGARGRCWVVAGILLYLAEMLDGSLRGAPAVTESLQGGTVLSPRQEVQQLWTIGRRWAAANGVDFDSYVINHLGIDDG
jgi:hypothetical protein